MVINGRGEKVRRSSEIWLEETASGPSAFELVARSAVDAGSFLVSTESGSQHILDLDQKVIWRAATSPCLPRRLRRDGEEVTLINVIECVVGRPMSVLVDLGIAGVEFTRRRTTRVVRIEAVEFEYDFVDTVETAASVPLRLIDARAGLEASLP